MGKIVKSIGKSTGLIADESAGSGAMGQSAALQARAVKELEKLGIPSIEAQKIVLENPELILSSPEDRLTDTALSMVQEDPELARAQEMALSEMQTLGQEGYSEEDKAKFNAMRRQVAGDEQARQAAILADMEARGAGGSGAQLAAQLASLQGATQRASEQGEQMAAEAAAARRGALAQAGQMAGNLSQQRYGRDANVASAKDQIAQFNAGVSARDTAARQAHEAARVSNVNQQEMFNKGLQQQKFQNELSKATGTTTALGNQAQGFANQAAAQANAANQAAAGMRGLVMGGASLAMSDMNNKENIKVTDSKSLDEFVDKLEPYDFNYKDETYGEGDQTGIMAQDLERSKIGKNIVEDTPEGKMVDTGKLTMSLAAAVKQLKDKVDSLEGNTYANGGIGGLGISPQEAELLRQESLNPTKDISMDNLSSQEVAAMEHGVVGSGQVSQKEFDAARNPEEIDWKKRLLDASKAMDQQSAGTPMKAQNVNPNSIASAIRGVQKGYADGGMAYEDGGAGTIIESGEESYSGDLLSDKINDGEMVHNLEMQDRLNQMLKELGERRVDEAVDKGKLVVNPSQQEELLAVSRGEKQPEEMANEDIIEEKGMKRLLRMLGSR